METNNCKYEFSPFEFIERSLKFSVENEELEKVLFAFACRNSFLFSVDFSHLFAFRYHRNRKMLQTSKICLQTRKEIRSRDF